jgi:hypothetical protein
LDPKGEGATHSLAVEGVRGTQFGRLERKLGTLYKKERNEDGRKKRREQ